MADTLLATQLRKGMIVKIENNLYRIFDRQHVTPGNLRGFVRVKMRNIKNGSMAEEKFRSEDIVERVSLEQKDMQYLYNDGDGYHFMDIATYDQVQLRAELLGDLIGFLKPEMNIQVEFYGENPIGIELPQTVDLKVVSTMPGIKGATATNQLKPATLETGVVVQVPPFINEGDMIRVNTETGEYQTRA
jgi:elongation factor P